MAFHILLKTGFQRFEQFFALVWRQLLFVGLHVVHTFTSSASVDFGCRARITRQIAHIPSTVEPFKVTVRELPFAQELSVSGNGFEDLLLWPHKWALQYRR